MDHLPPASAAPHGDENQLRVSWHVMLERRWLIISVFCLSVLASLIWAFQATPIYESTAVLQVDPESAGPLNLRDNVTFQQKDVEYYKTQEQNLRSRTLIARVAQKLALKDDERYKVHQDWLQAVSDDITIEPVRQTRLIKVHAVHPDRQKARDIANAIVDIFLIENADRKRGRSSEYFRMVKQEAQVAEDDFNKALRTLTEYRVKQGAASLEENADVVTKSYINAKEAYEQQARRSDAVTKIAEGARKHKEEGKDIALYPEVAEDLQVARIRMDLNTALANFANITNRYRPKHIKYQQSAGSVASLQQSLEKEARRVYDGLIEKASVERQNTAQALQKFEAAEKEKEKLSGLKVDYDVYAQKKDRMEVIYKLLVQKLKEYDLARNDVLQNMSIIDPAVAGTLPIKPRKPLIIAGGIAGGIALALALAFLMNYLDDSVKSQEDVETYLRLPFLGYIPNIKSASVVERDLQAHQQPTSSAAEGFRTLRASVALARNADKLRNIAVSSTIPSEGKSLVASNFAIVTAQTGLKTLLVDADLRRPSVHKAFQLQSPVGLAAYLAERVNSVDEIIHTTEVQHLDVVCCGAIPSNPSELISSKRMVQFLEEVSKRYDRIILDCPPISAVADPLVVGAMCDGLLFVAKFNKIRREHALRSVQRIHDAGIHPVGLVLNDIDFEGKDSYYYSYHYYQNRYYASHYRKHTAEAADKTPPPAKATKS